MTTDNNRHRTKPIKTDDPHNSLEVIWNHNQTKILYDGRKKNG